ncbi:MAG: HD domain-containing protein [Candidatus Paceibacteria bacterium]
MKAVDKEISLVERALRVAISAYKGQVRKDDGSPYIIHPVMVSMKLKEYSFKDVAIAAALVHDVLEDTPITQEHLGEELGAEVLEIVLSVSEDKSLPSWEERKKAYAQKVHSGSENAWAVSIADRIHNTESFIAAYKIEGDELWKKFSRGKKEQVWFLELLLDTHKGWDHPLMAEFQQTVHSFKQL